MTHSNEFHHEQERLHTTIHSIDTQIHKLAQIPRYYGDDFVEQILDDQRQQQLRNLKLAEPEPYFGRLDFAEGKATTPTPLYIGKVGVQNPDTGHLLVIDWRAPVSSMFYSFTGQRDTAAYESPEGEITGTIHLKRNLAIRKQILQRIVDSYVRGEENLGVTDEFLLYRLGENKDNKLRDIVSTIQHEQDLIIRAEQNKALIIQGVPGSGKTTVALHRLAYLLYQYQDKMKAEQIIIFAPNKMFVDYISDVLPELGVGGVQQTTFAEWASEILDDQISLQDPASRFTAWFERSQEEITPSDNHLVLTHFKGSLHFLQILEQAWASFIQQVVPQKEFVAWEGMRLTEETIREWFYEEYQHYPLLKRMERVFARMKRWIETEHKEILARDPKGDLRKKALQRLRTYMKAWPQHSLTELYTHLLSSISSTDITLQQIVSQQKQKKEQVEFEDLAPLLYLHHLLHGIDPKHTFHHVVIDEAQDFSPFQVAVLKLHCPLQSFTILGDLMQNIYTYQGIRNWSQFEELFSAERFGYYQLDRSYRSTMEIIHFANEVIAPFNDQLSPAKPVFRSGESVRVLQWNRSPAQVVDIVQQFRDKGANTIAIVTRTEADSGELHRSLATLGLEANLITSQQLQYRGGLSVVPIYLIKGMEFDAVLLVDVNAKHYHYQTWDAKLLYVGCTRALHQLCLLTSEEPSPLIANMDPQLFVTR